MKRSLSVLLALLCLFSLLPLTASAAGAAQVPTLSDLASMDESSRFTLEEVLALVQEAYTLGYQEGQKDAGVSPSPAPGIDYVLNTNTHKFHVPDCSSVADISPHNRLDFSGSREEVIAMGYVPCKRCKP